MNGGLLTRRKLLLGTGGLVLAVGASQFKTFSQRTRGQSEENPSAYLHIKPDNSVTFVITKGEMGQGIMTSLAMILAEELDCDWTRVQTEFAPVNPVLYGGMQGVYGSTSIRTMWTPMRQAGATARAMLLQAAAEKWKTDVKQLRTEKGYVLGATPAMRISYGELADAAMRLPTPTEVRVKNPKQFRIVGTPVKRLDTRAKVSGAAKFGIDAEVLGMLYAVTARCPVFGGKVASVDAAKAKAVAGVKDVVQISNGVAVIADNTWSAMQGRKALEIRWDEGANAKLSSAAIRARMLELAQKPGAIGRAKGNAPEHIAAAAKKVEAVYEAPYLAHACMEPLNCTAAVKADGCEIWASTQMPSGARQQAAEITGLKPDQIQVHSMFMGGGFGRRGSVDFIGEAVEVAQKAGAPVKLTWMREDDIRNGPFRPAAYVRLGGAVDGDGWPSALWARVVCPSFFGSGEGVDGIAVEGVEDLPYDFAHFQVEYHKAESTVPTTFWRSVGYSQNTFFAESFMDELAAIGGKDPLEVRRRMLSGSPRALKVLNVAAENAQWGKPAQGRSHGLALVNNIGSFTAQVAEVEMLQGRPKVRRIVCAIDCGRVVNPALVKQQIESGIVYGLTAALKGAITLENGRVQQGNFDRYEMLRIDEMPEIEVHIIPSEEEPGGVGEASVPPVAPAVANALFAATGKRLRTLPLRLSAS